MNLSVNLSERAKRCPVCGSSYKTQIANRDRYGCAGISWVLCRRCDFIYLDPTWSEEDYREFYRGQYREWIEAYRGEQDIEKNQRRYGEALARFLQFHIGKPVRRITDIGGSTGVVASCVSRTFGNPYTIVVDPCETEVKRARDLVSDAIVGTVFDVTPNGSDLVLMCRSIDHITKPLRAMEKIAELIGDDGHAYVDFSDWLMVARSEGVQEALHVDHPSNFTEQSFAKLVARAGLTPVAEFIPPKSSCHGFILERGAYNPSRKTNLFADIRRLQAEERKSWQKSAY